jgi:aldose 1-epimerase
MVKIDRKSAGVLTDGTDVSVYTLDNGNIRVSVMDYGCLITSILLPDAASYGGFVDVNLGFSTLDSWVHRNNPGFGALVGRYANRIKGGTFELDGTTYTLDKNNLGNCLHSGTKPYRARPWASGPYRDKDWGGVHFFGVSPAGDQGFPGTLTVDVYYLLNSDNELLLRYIATTDAPTPINMTNHAYFNLGGHNSGTIADHVCEIRDNPKRLEVADADLVPTGKILDVKGTVFDFSTPTAFGKSIGSKELAATNGGFDACYVWTENTKMITADDTEYGIIDRVTVTHPESGRSLVCSTNQPCIQVYTSNNLKPTVGKDGFTYDQYGAFCLETAQYTNAPNIPSFPSATLLPDETYDAVTIYKFGF